MTRRGIVIAGTAAALLLGGLTGPASAVAAHQPVPRCSAVGVRIAVGPLVRRSARVARTLRFTNVSQRTCVLRGYPTVTVTSRDGRSVATIAHTRNGVMGGLSTGTTIPGVVVTPGQTASSLVEAVWSPGSCSSYTHLRVVAPGGQVSVLPYGLGSCGRLEVHPVVPGTTGRPTAMPTIPLVNECYPSGTRRGLYQPRTIMLACADGNVSVEELAWTSWAASAATAEGRFTFNLCTPSCARGRFVSFPATIRLTSPHLQRGRAVFRQIVVTYIGRRPTGSPKTMVYDL